MSTLESAPRANAALQSIHAIEAWLIDVSTGRQPCDRTILDDVRERLEEAFSAGARDQMTLGALTRASILSGDRDRAKTMLELLVRVDPHNALVHAILPELNLSLGLARDHNTFAADANTNSSSNEQELAARSAQLDSTPRTLEVASTNVCNIDPPCVHCWKHVDPAHGYLNRDAFHMPKELIRRLAPWIGRAEQVSLHGIGEPLAHPQLFDSVAHTGPGTEVVFVSNALLLTDSRVEAILDHGVGTIDFSLDAATPETFRKIRNSDLSDALAGIQRLKAARDARGADRPQICVNMCLMRENVHEAASFVELAKRIGAASVHLFHMNKGASYSVGWFDYDAQHCEHDAEAHDAAIAEAHERAEELGIPLLLSGRSSFGSEADDETKFYNETVDERRFFCKKPWTSLLVQNSGDVYNCCWQDRPIGNLHQMSIWDVWNGEVAKEIRESTAAGVPHPVCINQSGNLCPYLGRV